MARLHPMKPPLMAVEVRRKVPFTSHLRNGKTWKQSCWTRFQTVPPPTDTKPRLRSVFSLELCPGDHVTYWANPDTKIVGVITSVALGVAEIKVSYACHADGRPRLAQCGGRRTIPPGALVQLMQ